MTLRVAKIIHNSVTDGPGLRTAVFFQGCPHNCEGCHNPSLLNYQGGSEWTVEALLDKIAGNPLDRGVTFTGGEPMEQAEALIPAAAALKERGYNLWVYTGYIWEELDGARKELAGLANVVADGLYITARRTLSLPWRGSDNQRLIDVSGSLREGKVVEL